MHRYFSAAHGDAPVKPGVSIPRVGTPCCGDQRGGRLQQLEARQSPDAQKVDGDSVWELFIGHEETDVYKYCVTTRAGDLVYKADPYAFTPGRPRPVNGGKVYDIFLRLCVAR